MVELNSIAYGYTHRLHLPSVTISVDMEINHLVKVGAAVAVVGAVYAPELLATSAPAVVDFLSQLGNLSPNLMPVGG